MSRRAWIPALAFLVLVLVDAPGTCDAGMFGVSLSDTARMRLQGISLFGVCVWACVWVVRRIWNSLADDFPRLPRLSNGKAVGVVALFGLLFLLTITIISGARELITAEDRYIEHVSVVAVEGSEEAARNAGRLEQSRRDRLESLSVLLRHYAGGHGGMFPADERVPEIPAEAWQLPDLSRMRYLYVKGQIAKGATSILAYEPGIFGKERLVLMTDGAIRTMMPHEFEALLIQGAK